MASSASSSTNAVTPCCIVCSLLKKGFSSYSFADKLSAIEKGRPKPPLRKLTTKIKTCTRYFHADLYNQYEWLTGCETIGKLFCWCCLLFVNGKGTWNENGFSDLNNLHKVIKRHTISRAHLEAIIRLKVFGKSSIEHTIDEKLKISHRPHNELVEKNRAVLKRLIDVVCFLGTHELSFKSHDESGTSTNRAVFKDLLCLLSTYDAPLKKHLQQSEQSVLFRATSNRIQSNLISAIAAVLLERIKLEIKKTRFLAIVFGEVTEIGQLSAILRYLSDGIVQERFIGFIDVGADKTAESLYKTVCDLIKDIGCDAGEKLVAQSYDGATVKSEQLEDLQVKVKQTFQNALFIHYFGHRLHLILFQSVAHIKQCKIISSILFGISNFFSKSANRTQAFDLIVRRRLPKVPPTRWNYNGQLVQTVSEYRHYLIELFENILENSCDWDTETLNCSKGYLEYLKSDFSFNFLLNLYSEIFPFCDNLFNTLQNNSNDVEFCIKGIEEFKRIINAKRNDFERLWEKTTEIGELEPPRKRLRPEVVDDLKSTYRRLLFEIIDQIEGQISNRFNNFNDLKFIELCNFSEFKDETFPDDAFQSLISHYECDFSAVALRSELTVIYTTEDTNSKTNAYELLNYLKQTELDKAYVEVSKLCELVLTIPTTSLSMERSFSVLERINNFVGNSTSEDRLSKLSLLSIEKDLLKEISEHPRFYDDVIDEFATTDRRIELHYK